MDDELRDNPSAHRNKLKLRNEMFAVQIEKHRDHTVVGSDVHLMSDRL